jgi:hypothetical protein
MLTGLHADGIGSGIRMGMRAATVNEIGAAACGLA